MHPLLNHLNLYIDTVLGESVFHSFFFQCSFIMLFFYYHVLAVKNLSYGTSPFLILGQFVIVVDKARLKNGEASNRKIYFHLSISIYIYTYTLKFLIAFFRIPPPYSSLTRFHTNGISIRSLSSKVLSAHASIRNFPSFIWLHKRKCYGAHCASWWKIYYFVLFN